VWHWYWCCSRSGDWAPQRITLADMVFKSLLHANDMAQPMLETETVGRAALDTLLEQAHQRAT
jgi:hypothetical protein